MQGQVAAIDLYRIKMCALKGWPEDLKVLILWDVYVHHRDTDLIEWMKNEFKHIIVLYIHANLTVSSVWVFKFFIGVAVP